MKAVFDSRGENYADIADNARIFSSLMLSLGVTTPSGMSDVHFYNMCMICGKLARYGSPGADRNHEDTFIDIANYSILIAADRRRNLSEAAVKVMHGLPDAS